MTTPDRKEAFLAYTEGGYLKGKELPAEVFEYLTKTFNEDNITSKYKEYHKIFFLTKRMKMKAYMDKPGKFALRKSLY